MPNYQFREKGEFISSRPPNLSSPGKLIFSASDREPNDPAFQIEAGKQTRNNSKYDGMNPFTLTELVRDSRRGYSPLDGNEKSSFFKGDLHIPPGVDRAYEREGRFPLEGYSDRGRPIDYSTIGENRKSPLSYEENKSSYLK